MVSGFTGEKSFEMCNDGVGSSRDDDDELMLNVLRCHLTY